MSGGAPLRLQTGHAPSHGQGLDAHQEELVTAVVLYMITNAICASAVYVHMEQVPLSQDIMRRVLAAVFMSTRVETGELLRATAANEAPSDVVPPETRAAVFALLPDARAIVREGGTGTPSGRFAAFIEHIVASTFVDGDSTGGSSGEDSGSESGDDADGAWYAGRRSDGGSGGTDCGPCDGDRADEDPGTTQDEDEGAAQVENEGSNEDQSTDEGGDEGSDEDQSTDEDSDTEAAAEIAGTYARLRAAEEAFASFHPETALDAAVLAHMQHVVR
jgi:hypothetical protein